MAKRQALLHGAACILCGALILPVSAADNLHFSGSLVASPCTLTMQGTGIAEVDFSSLDLISLPTASLLVSLWCLNSRIAIRR